ncbi:NACHT domain-containing NTPase [Chryseobacterium sp. NKUCC03_KSP]|uniref:NACHT domain-containing protein n=1 Tax=Chryseobacterium sp. NKUCC03_KSP TaxID=2842125 RepID=UPI001C5B47FC|nr:AAA family ATPase [Chryseobacterium sp. NKUCC03_KSP]MBW3524687.1 AAA family ATPase [Chryseobacterium sp. NKUCC03_KSP]
MLVISYHNPEIQEEALKPIAYANQSYPYNQISSDRRFEELVYSIVKHQLDSEEFSKFDSISLMSGVSELGRDCALFKDGYSDGIIQCKKYEKNLSKEDFGKEITKFVLYSLLENKILNQPATFTYYIAVSKGFVRDCSDFIDSFQHEILLEPKLGGWVNYNINKYVSLNYLKINQHETLQKVRDILSKIAVKKITPADLDGYLSDERSKHLSSLFFEVRTVTDNSLISKLREDLLQKFSEKAIDGVKLGIELNRGSISLRSEKNEFSEIPDSHIEREETNLLFDWINSDLKKDKAGKVLNFCLLAGNAGMGKTVILKDLYDKLSGGNTAVLGLKADKLVSSSIKELQEKIGLSLPVYEFIEECKQEFKTTVILIDQIDALSQSMSSDRSYLQVFKDLVDQYLHDENVRIIISVRIFDLHYDPSLRLYKNIETVTVKHLSEDQVKTEIAKLGIGHSMLSRKLLNLLKVPNQLNVFSRIYNSNRSSLGITTLQDMYLELWKQKITDLPHNSAADKQLTKKLLYKIADKMFNEQQITVSELQFEDYSRELSYVESERLIKKEGYQIQFFHQSFYDFVFAKQFIESGKNLNQYIKDNGQSLLIRSAVKMMLNYLRDFDPLQYKNILSTVFNDDQILYHIKHMTLSLVLFYEKPTKDETNIILNAISNSFHLCVLFFDQGASEYWFKFALKNSLVEILNTEKITITNTKNIDSRELMTLKNIASNFLRNAAMLNYDGSWQFISELKDQSYVRNILFSITDWSDPLSYKVFEASKNFKEFDSYGFYHTIDNIAKVNPEYALQQLALHFKSKPHNKNSEGDYEERSVLKTLAKSAPQKLFPLIFEMINKDFGQIESGKALIGNYRYMQIDLQEKDTLSGNEYLFRLLGVCLRRSATNQNQEFITFFESHKNSRLKPLLRLLIFALRTNEVSYPDPIFEITNYLLSLNEIYHDSTLAIENRIVFEKSFPFFSEQKQKTSVKQIKQIVNRNEIYYTKKTDTTQAIIRSWWGISKFSWVRRLPQVIIEQDQELKKCHLELKRKFPDYKDEEKTGRIMAGVVQAPLSEDAYKYMNQSQWIASFKKYNGTIGHFEKHFLKGDIEEHANAFKRIVKNDPSNTKLEVIKAALADSDVKLKYPIYGIWGWAENNFNLEVVIPLFKQILTLDLDSELRRICLHIAKDLTGMENDDSAIINFLISSALDFEPEQLIEMDDDTETSINNLITKGINTYNGSAASSLLHIKDITYKDLIFNTLETVLFNGAAHSRAAVLYQFAYLMSIDPERAFKVFKDVLIDEKDVHVLASSMWSLQYMGNYDFQQLIPVFSKLVSSEFLGGDDSRWLFIILYGSFLFNKPGAEELLHKLVVTNKHACSRSINVIMENYYAVEGSVEKNNKLLDFVLEKATEEDFDNLSWSFGSSLHLKLTDIKLFLNNYVRSKYFRINDSLIEYLTFQCNQYPSDAIELFDLSLGSNKFEKSDRHGIYSSESGTKFIVNALNSLIKNDSKSEALRWKLMIAFDNVLKDHRFRADTDRVLEDLV